jgi:hypothetical protein
MQCSFLRVLLQKAPIGKGIFGFDRFWLRSWFWQPPLIFLIYGSALKSKGRNEYGCHREHPLAENINITKDMIIQCHLSLIKEANWQLLLLSIKLLFSSECQFALTKASSSGVLEHLVSRFSDIFVGKSGTHEIWMDFCRYYWLLKKWEQECLGCVWVLALALCEVAHHKLWYHNCMICE